ncbi:MAG: DMT family transporter [Inquilinus sp.]|nr:DMT family transporter [Inquilinus sp.]
MPSAAHTPAPSAPDGRIVARGIGLYCFAIVLLSVMDAMIKWMSAGYPTVQIVFFRSLFGLAPLVFVVARSGGLAALATRRWGAHLARGLIGVCAALAFFHAFSVMPLADAYAIAFASPLFITALSVPLLRESVGPRRWAAVAVGFGGVVVMLRPGSAGLDGLLQAGAAAALVGTICFAVSVVLIRRLARTETNAAIVFHSGLVAVAASALLLPFGFVLPGLVDFLLLAAIGLIGGTGAIAMTAAFRSTPVAILAPFEYTAMIWAVVLGFAFWGDLPDRYVWIGCAIVVASGLYILHRETRRGGTLDVAPRAVPKPAGTASAPSEAP